MTAAAERPVRERIEQSIAYAWPDADFERIAAEHKVDVALVDEVWAAMEQLAGGAA